MATAPLTRKPVPKSVGHWERELEGACRYLDQIAALAKDNGDKWVRTNRHYMQTRILHLIDEQPAPVRRRGPGYTIKIGKADLTLQDLVNRYCQP